MANFALFDCSEFFEFLLSNPDCPLPNWETARKEINGIFFQLHADLINRVKKHLEFDLPSRLITPRQAYEESLADFEKRKHAFFFGHFVGVCWELKEEFEKALEKGTLDNHACGMLLDEVERLGDLLNIIDNIVNQPTGSDLYAYEQFMAAFYQQQLEDLSTPTEFTISSDEEVESMKRIENESSDGEDFEVYNEEIVKVTSAANDSVSSFSTIPASPTIASPRVLDCGWKPFGNCGQQPNGKRDQKTINVFDDSTFDAMDSNFTEFSLASTTIDTADLLRVTAYRKLARQRENEKLDVKGYGFAALGEYLSH